VEVNRPNPLLEDAAPPSEPVIERLRALSRGSKIVLGGCALLFLDLFLTWQNLEVPFGPAGTATVLLDGWDAWGLLIGLTCIGLFAVVTVVYATDLEIPEEVRWELWILVASVALFAMTLLKNLLDASSSWASYLGVLLAAAVAVGAFLNLPRSGRRRRRKLVLR
jgi:hypothetical protein